MLESGEVCIVLGIRVADMGEDGSALRSRSFLSLKWLALASGQALASGH